MILLPVVWNTTYLENNMIPDKQTHRDLVRTYLSRNPGSTVSDIRDGIHGGTGIMIERVQARLNDISKLYHLVIDATGMGDMVKYSLGALRKAPRGVTQLRFPLPEELPQDESQGLRGVMETTMAQWFRARSTKGSLDLSAVPNEVDLADLMAHLDGEPVPAPTYEWMDVLEDL